MPTTFGSTGDDTIFGSSLNDAIYGGPNQSGPGNDTMFGGQGNDTMEGGEGADHLDGNLGDDLLIGGIGADVYQVASGGGADRILGFQPGIDDIKIQSNINGTNITSGATLLGHISSDGQGGTRIDLGGGHSLVVANVAPGSLGAGDFLFF